ncbi:MAG: glycosyltransferase family 2 protein [Planctomycetota bacterium]
MMESATNQFPDVSVVMPAYNAGVYLLDAVASIIEQNFRNWELVVVNDGSTDGTPHLLEWFAEQDQRIRVVHQANSGIVAALNRACQEARAPLLARMDCDDIALPDRLKKQVSFMKRNDDCVVVGGAILEIDSDGDPLSFNHLPSDSDDIVSGLLHRRTGHFHPSTMIRAEAFHSVGGYRPQYQWVEDHDLWLRLAEIGQLRNLTDVVLCYRQHAKSVCWSRAQTQRELMNQLLSEAYQSRGTEMPASLQLDTETQRSVAGPGKWARAAAKGGFTRTAWKQLGQLNRSDASMGYKLRMNLEATTRCALNSVRCLLRGHPNGNEFHQGIAAASIPTFPEWHQRWEQSVKQHAAA